MLRRQLLLRVAAAAAPPPRRQLDSLPALPAGLPGRGVLLLVRRRRDAEASVLEAQAAPLLVAALTGHHDHLRPEAWVGVRRVVREDVERRERRDAEAWAAYEERNW